MCRISDSDPAVLKGYPVIFYRILGSLYLKVNNNKYVSLKQYFSVFDKISSHSAERMSQDCDVSRDDAGGGTPDR